MKIDAKLQAITAKLPPFVRAFLQKIILSMQLSNKNGLLNHAAACAYGFLFSMAPMILLVFLIIFNIYERSPDAVTAFVHNIPLLEMMFDEHWLINDFFLVTRPGISGVISVISILWAARILALSIQRGLKIIFPYEKKRNPISNTIIILAIETSVLLLVLILIVGSMTVFRFYMLFPILNHIPMLLRIIVTRLGRLILPVTLLGVVSFFTYMFVPVKPPSKLSAFQGALLGTIAYGCTAFVLSFVTDVARYNFIYGALGSLIVLLINVFFFFIFFFIGAQLVYVTDSFEILFFSAMRKMRLWEIKKKKASLLRCLFDPSVNGLGKYLQNYNEGEIINFPQDNGDLIYYLHEGQIEIIYPQDHVVLSTNSKSEVSRVHNSVLEAGSFFGETGYLLSEIHPLSITCRTAVSVLAFPLSLFETILKLDMDIDKEIIEHLANRLKHHI